MPEKLLTLEELSEYLQIKKDTLAGLVERGVISAYKIGGELLRFRRDQIDAIRSEIDSRITEEDRLVLKAGVHRKHFAQENVSFSDRISDFFYFNDFYILSAGLIALLLFVIFKK